MGTTGHNSEASIHSYAKKCPAMKRRQMSYALATDFIKKPKTPKKKQATSTASVPAPEESNQNDTDPSIVTF